LSHAFLARANWGEWTSTPAPLPPAETAEVILIRPLLSGSGKFGTPWLRMHAEYAVGSPDLELFEEPAFVWLLLVPICATFAPDEPPPQAAAIRDSPTAPTIASARADRFVIRAPFAEFAIWSPSQLSDPRV
jgi:hypothetical protein